MNIYDQLKAAGAQIDNHESDLYVKADDVSRPIIEAARTKGDPAAKNATTFRNQRPEEKGQIWYDIPFAYSPWWEARIGKR